MTSALGFASRNYKTFFPPNPPKEPNALKFGILGAAKIAPPALINPALSHPDVVIAGIAARDQTRAQAFAKKHGIPRVYNSYQELLNDPTIDVVYNPLPNGLHYEWTIKALKAGKHVLLEKPATNTSEEAAKLFALAKEKNLVLLEAFHHRFHPAIQTVKSIVESGTIGKVKGVEAELAAPSVVAPPGDIRRNLALGGGALMDMGGYTINTSRYILGSNPTDVLHIQLNSFPEDKRVDRSMRSVLEFPNDATAAIYVDLGMPKHLGLIPRIPRTSATIDGELGSVYINNYMAPSIYHYITVTIKGTGKEGAKTQTIKAYTFEHLDTSAKGEAWWTTYRYMLEAFVDKVRGRTPQTWISEEDTLANMKTIEMVYENSGLGIRPASTYVPE